MTSSKQAMKAGDIKIENRYIAGNPPSLVLPLRRAFVEPILAPEKAMATLVADCRIQGWILEVLLFEAGQFWTLTVGHFSMLIDRCVGR